MTHPTREEWITYLYDEFDHETRANLNAHLHVCPDCKTSLSKWRGTMTELNEWKIPAPGKLIATETAWPLLRWAAAALIVLGFGFGFGRLSSTSSANVAKLQATLLPALRQELQREFKADFEAALNTERSTLATDFQRQLRTGLEAWAANAAAASNLENRRVLAEFVQSYKPARADDLRAMLTLMQRLDKQNRGEYARLRKDLETVAVVTDNRFSLTQNQIGQLASYTLPTHEP
jgi:hypothetical protein